MSLVLNQDNDWSGVFSDLPEYNNGVKIVYTVEEVKLNYYDSVVSGDANKGFVITNYFNPPPPPETTAPETTEPSETTAPETTEPPETTALETTEPPETTVPETTDPTETTAPETETSTPPETTTSESTEPPETIAIETTEPPETTVSETTEPPETQVESTPVTDLHAPQTGENKTLFIRAALVIISAGVLFLLFANKKKKLN
jgi:LPXTG-motif cell wall-anchored protein